jgi:hypothetical protein
MVVVNRAAVSLVAVFGLLVIVFAYAPGSARVNGDSVDQLTQARHQVFPEWRPLHMSFIYWSGS